MPQDKAPAQRKPRAPRKTGSPALYAAVDLGTNNCRLLVAERRKSGFRVVDSHSKLARLGEGLAASGRLSDAALERGLTAMKEIRAKLKRRGVAQIRCIATEACRKAENARDFVDRVRDETGLTFKIIGPAEEARLAVISCHDLFEADAPRAMVLDIGGGSTELSFIDASKMKGRALVDLVAKPPIVAWKSFPLGVVTLAESFAHLPEAEGFEAMTAHARDVFADWKETERLAQDMKLEGAHIVGTSGTVTCLAGVHLKLDRYRRDDVDGVWMDRHEGQAVVDHMRGLSVEGRAHLPTIGPERASLMLSGCAILDAAWDTWPAARMRVADRGLREGLLLTMMHGPKKPRRRRGGRTRRGKRAEAGESVGARDGG